MFLVVLRGTEKYFKKKLKIFWKDKITDYFCTRFQKNSKAENRKFLLQDKISEPEGKEEGKRPGEVL